MTEKIESEDLGMGFLWAIQEGFKGNKILPFLQKHAQSKVRITVEVVE